jgi:hypothetical protein
VLTGKDDSCNLSPAATRLEFAVFFVSESPTIQMVCLPRATGSRSPGRGFVKGG